MTGILSDRTSPWSASSDPIMVTMATDVVNDASLSGFHTGHRHLRLPNVTEGEDQYVIVTVRIHLRIQQAQRS